MTVPPIWCADKMNCWEMLVDEWCLDAWLAVHNNTMDRRAQLKGVPHNQGNTNLYLYRRNWAGYNMAPAPEVVDLYAMAHTTPFKEAKAFCASDPDHPENFTNISSHNKLVKYKDVGKARKADGFSSSGQFDLELVMESGGGRSHGSRSIGDKASSTANQALLRA
ncbi:hypothetical protein ACQJBY_059353 [Aegilops geniculata]